MAKRIRRWGKKPKDETPEERQKRRAKEQRLRTKTLAKQGIGIAKITGDG